MAPNPVPLPRRNPSRKPRPALNTAANPTITLGDNSTPDILTPSSSPSPQQTSPSLEQGISNAEALRGRPAARSEFLLPANSNPNNVTVARGGQSATKVPSRSRPPSTDVDPNPVPQEAQDPPTQDSPAQDPDDGDSDYSDDSDADFEEDPEPDPKALAKSINRPLKKGRKSIGDVARRGQDLVSELMEQTAEAVKDLRDDLGIRKFLRGAKAHLKRIKEYQPPDEVPKDDIESFSFSRVDEHVLGRLGIRPGYESLSVKQTTEMFPLFPEESGIVKEFGETIAEQGGPHHITLKAMVTTFGTQFETFSRSLIDLFAAWFAAMLMTCTSLELQNLAMTEATPKKPNDKKRGGKRGVIDIIWNGMITLLSGRLDFVFLTFPKNGLFVKERKEAQRSNDFVTKTRKLTSYEWGRDLRLFVLEAKANQTAGALRKHIPQVAAQCRAT
ncbi:hypothetical protein BDN72DRAFT_855236 [Pluteus cervinus]|uniref:Uncharacterized protein n=1 Tax=Pluteus cervinus TaxID=181527 RepID=A0ACD3B4Y1_9AGAR|nr:hypothetical protein BDN72DRAFT_855236 [Pluteus cervinus]